MNVISLDCESNGLGGRVFAAAATALREAALIALDVDAYNHAYRLKSAAARHRFPDIDRAYRTQQAPG